MGILQKTHRKFNEVFLDDDGVIRSIYHGAQTAVAIERTIIRIQYLMEQLIKEGKPVRLLSDIRDMGEYEQPARLIEMRARTMLPFWKMAIVASGSGSVGERVSRQLTLMSARKKEIRYFRREDDALGWLSFMPTRSSLKSK